MLLSVRLPRWARSPCMIALLTALAAPGVTFADASYPPAPLPLQAQKDLQAARPTSRPAPSVRAYAVAMAKADGGPLLFAKNAEQVLPIASLSKLMAAMVLLDQNLPLTDEIAISPADVDTIRHSRSHLPVGTVARRVDLLHVALLASENRATYALARTSRGGTADFVARMNAKAQALGMVHTHFNDPTGLDGGNVSTVTDLLRMANAAYRYPAIRAFSTQDAYTLVPSVGRPIAFRNTDKLVRDGQWPVEMSKTGFVNEAGYCLILRWQAMGQPVVMALLNAPSAPGRYATAERLNAWLSGPATATVARDVPRPHGSVRHVQRRTVLVADRSPRE